MSFTNRLVNESSPYLLQHAHNPVDWYPWSEEALNKAKAEDKPILVSIGYAACHWCHVMERESFQNPAVATIMNEKFINIKIDREERPDLDHIYMDAVQAIAGNGGWPLNVFLTTDAKPFYGGTYFPPQRAFNRSSWTEVLSAISDAWVNKRNDIEEQAEQLLGHIKQSNSFGKKMKAVIEAGNSFSLNDMKNLRDNLMKNADKKDGGFGAAPKFPQTFSIRHLISHASNFNDEVAASHALLSLHKMIDGGIYDQVGGGLSRYSTDEKWLVPHFEKMLYDNALLLVVLCEAYQFTSDEYYANAVKHIFRFLEREMKDKEGGYYAALDADSEGVEGKFYVWDKDEINEILGEEGERYCKYYNVTEEGNWEHKNILHITEQSRISAVDGGTETALIQLIQSSNEKLLERRESRIRPATDDKIILGWNALLLTAYCKAYEALQSKEYLDPAIELESFIDRTFRGGAERGYFHTYKNGKARYPAFLDDYAYYIQALIALQEVSSDQGYMQKAKDLTKFVSDHFSDDESTYFYYTNSTQEDVVIRKVEWHDGATPSANAVMAKNLHYLGIIFDESTWIERASRMVTGLGEAIIKYPGSFGVWASELENIALGMNEIAVTANADVLDSARDSLLKLYIPNRLLQSGNTDHGMALLKNKKFKDDPGFYLCRNYECKAPVSSAAELIALIDQNKTERTHID